MRTNVVIDNDLLEEAFSISHYMTKKKLIHEALKDFIRLRKQKDLTEIAGTINFCKGFDHKKLRRI